METFFHTSGLHVKSPCSATNTAGCFKDGGVLGKIPQNRLYPLGIKILSLYPLPNYNPVGNDNFNYRTQASSQTPERNDTLRIDYNISKNWRMWGRWLNTAATSILPYGNSGLGLSTNLPDYVATQKTPKYSYSGTVTGTLNPTTVVEFTYGISHNLIDLRVSTDVATRATTGLSTFHCCIRTQTILIRSLILHGAVAWRMVQALIQKAVRLRISTRHRTLLAAYRRCGDLMCLKPGFTISRV